nr:hypothetical protein [Nostoc sp. EkiNYC01]
MSNHQIPDTIKYFVGDENTPDKEPRKPIEDPTLGINLSPHAPVNQDHRTPQHRLVTCGDSLTHGFQSGAIFNTNLSYPMIIAWEMGWDTYFRHPNPYVGPGGGLPLNLEFLTRDLEQHYGNSVNWWELPLASWTIHQFMDKVEDYWERGIGSKPRSQEGHAINHNLSVYGWKVSDLFTLTSDSLTTSIGQPSNNWLFPLIEHHQELAALPVLGSARISDVALTAIEAARVLGKDGSVEDNNGFGIETLIMFIGANNVLGSIIELDARWSCDPQIDPKKSPTVWCPNLFDQELTQLVTKVENIKAKHVIWATVPHVTIAPLAHGIGNKTQPGSRYFSYYTRPWISDAKFNPFEHPHLTRWEARAIDTVIDQYNYSITNVVKNARNKDLDWYIFDVAGLLDRLAQRRYIEDPLARPSWWTPYELPSELQSLNPIPNSRFFQCDANGRTDGGLFSLDGVHPTTIGYGLIAQEIINIMKLAGVKFYFGDTSTFEIYQSNILVACGESPTVSERQGSIRVDFKRLISKDTLITTPPRAFASGLSWVKVIDENLNLFSRLFQVSVR